MKAEQTFKGVTRKLEIQSEKKKTMGLLSNWTNFKQLLQQRVITEAVEQESKRMRANSSNAKAARCLLLRFPVCEGSL